VVDKPFDKIPVAMTSRDVQKCLLRVCRLRKTLQPFSIEDLTSSSIYTIFPDTFLDSFRITFAHVGEDLRSLCLCQDFSVFRAFCIPLDTLFVLCFLLVRLSGFALGSIPSLLFALTDLGSFGSSFLLRAALFCVRGFFLLTSETSAVFCFGFAFAFAFVFEIEVEELREPAMTTGTAMRMLEQEARTVRSQSTEALHANTNYIIDWDSQQKLHVVIVVFVIVRVATLVVGTVVKVVVTRLVCPAI
jgi:hypothetical protein